MLDLRSINDTANLHRVSLGNQICHL